MTLRSLLSKNIVVVIMVPTLIGAHYGWYKLQAMDSLVPLEDRNKIPKWIRPETKD